MIGTSCNSASCYLSRNHTHPFHVLVSVSNVCSDEGWNDWRTDWIGSEQALDYNAGFTVALAAATELPKSFWTTKCSGALLMMQLWRWVCASGSATIEF